MCKYMYKKYIYIVSYLYSDTSNCAIMYIHELEGSGARTVGLWNRMDVVSTWRTWNALCGIRQFMLVRSYFHRLRMLNANWESQSHPFWLGLSDIGCFFQSLHARLRHKMARNGDHPVGWDTFAFLAGGRQEGKSMEKPWKPSDGWRRGGGCCFEHLYTVTAV